jgi:5-carboxymethyl-2-hydroxymuconate isomerase
MCCRRRGGSYLEERGIEVRHVLETGNAVPTELLEERLIEAYHDGLFQLSLFGEGDVRKDAVRRAYGRRYQDVARKSG